MSMAATRSIAPISRRVVAYVIDAAIIAVLSGVGYGIAFAPLLGVQTTDELAAALIGMTLVLGLFSLVLLAWWLVMTAMQGGAGSIGMRIMKLCLVKADSGEKLGFGRALLRNIVFGLTGAIIVGYFSPLFDGSGRFQGWHDKAGNALMLDVRGVTAAVSTEPSARPPVPPAPPVLPAPGNGSPAPRPVPAQFPGAASFPAAAPLPGGAPAPVVPQSAPGTPPVLPAPPVPGTTPAPALSQPVPPAPVAPVDGGEDLIAFVPGITVTTPPARPVAPVAAPEPASVVPAPVVPAPVASSVPTFNPEASGLDDDLESTRISVPGHRMIFTWDDGTRIAVSGRTIFGRNPSQELGAIVVPVRDETLSLSKTHFEAAAEPNGAWVMDRFSTNGVTIVRDGVRIACPPGTRVPIRLGDAIEIGDRIVTVGGYV